jgi:hypothetical protein
MPPIMTETYRDILVFICMGLLSWGIIRVERIYQYPFFMGSMFVSFILPQAFSLVDNPGSAVSQEALERVLLFSCFCAAACWVGYQIKPNKQWLAKLNIVIDERKLFKAGIALMVQGYLFNFLLSRITIQRSAVNGNWTGPATIFLFFGSVIYIAFAIFLLQSLKRPNTINLVCVLLSAWFPVQSVLAGRRQPTMTFIIFIGLSLLLIYRYVPPRWLIITAVLLLAVIIPVVGQLRAGFWELVFSGNWQEILSSSQNAFASQQKGEILELRNAALLMDASERIGYGYGTTWWDAIIFQYVPGQIVGYDLKKSLQFNWITNESLQELYGYSVSLGTTPTGVGDSFTEFGYFGCIIFALMGYVLKNLWISAFYQKSVISRLLYMGLVSPAMIGITHGIGRFWQEAIFQVGFIWLVAYYSRVKDNSYYIKAQLKNVGGINEH